jgi:hypothetical protein
MYKKLHILINSLKRYTFSELDKLSSVKNGVYLIFEKGERFENYDRIVRVGSHPSQDRFFGRLTDHFLEKQRSRIVRKHIGRCFLNQNNDPYIKVWNLTNKQVKKGSEGEKMLDRAKEFSIEQKISYYLNNFSICIIPELSIKSQRMRLESKLIATLNQEGNNYISTNWLGRFHPDTRIVESGLWNIQGLNGTALITAEDLDLIRKKTKNEQA